MTMDERVEAAAREWWRFAGMDPIEAARAALAAAFPELHGDQPKGWIAPWDPTDKMCLATTAGAADEVSDALRWDVEHEWKSLRDAYLGKGDGAAAPEWDELRGAAPDITEGLSSEEWVRKKRDEWR